MSNYSGEAAILFTIERIKDSLTGEYREATDDDDDDDIQELTLQVVGRASYTHSRSYGEPEDCFPEEYDVEITSIQLNNQEIIFDLTDDELAHMEEEIENAVSESIHDHY